MALKGPFVGLEGGGSGGLWLGDKTEYFNAARVNELRQALFLFAGGTFHRSLPIGGSRTRGLMYTGVIDAVDSVPFDIDNTGNYVGSSSGVLVPITVWVRVESSLIAVIPRLYNMTLSSVASTAGGVACTATADDYTGANQRQTLLLSLPSGVNTFKLQFVSTGATHQFWGQGWRSLYL